MPEATGRARRELGFESKPLGSTAPRGVSTHLEHKAGGKAKEESRVSSVSSHKN